MLSNPEPVGYHQAMTARLVYIVGQPGSGKSTLMAALTTRWDRHAIAPCESYPVAHDVLTDKKTGAVEAVELGKRRELFSGTDSLASSIIDKAAPWIATQPYDLVLAEGARLANKRFLEAAMSGGYQVVLVLLDHAKAEDWRMKRSADLGREQNEGWVRGRLSASRNLAEWALSQFSEGRPITVLRGSPSDVTGTLGLIESRLA